MDLSRYRDKAYLVTYELTTDIFEAYDIKIDDIVPIRSVYILYTDKGVKVLKKVNYGIDELQYINSVINHVRSNGYNNAVTFMNTMDGCYYTKRDDGTYVILNLVEGREADYQNPLDVRAVSRELCNFHKATKGYKGVIEKRNNLFKWIPAFRKRSNDLLKFKEIAELHEIKTEFDRIYLDYVDRYYKQAIESLELLIASDYEKLCHDTAVICHHDLAYHNIMMNFDNDVFFIDFDYCIQDLRIHDIANLTVKAIKNCNWDAEKAQNILESYNKADTLQKEELEVMYAFLLFPQDFYEISRQYYMKTKNWDEEDFLSRLIRKSGYYNDRQVFLEVVKEVTKTGI